MSSRDVKIIISNRSVRQKISSLRKIILIPIYAGETDFSPTKID